MSPRGKRDPDTPFLSRTEVSAERTAAEIHEILGRRAKHVMTEFNAGEVVSISFSLEIQGKEVLFRLPIRWRQYLKVLQEAAKKKVRGNVQVDPEQARRTAWRVAMAGLVAQLAWVDSGMVEIQEIFLPYVVQGKDQETLYEKLSRNGFLIEHKP